jgi:type I restriction enzyme S subunit
MPTLEAFHVCAPDPDTQRQIVAALKPRLADAAALRAALNEQMADLTALPQRLLAQAFKD